MGYNQGVSRLRGAFVRSLTPHEVKRGYIFISTDKNLPTILETNDFEVEIGGAIFSSRRLDVSGRVHVPRRILESIGTVRKLRFSLVSRQMLRIEPVSRG